jgi:hypothetical protein
MKKGKKNKNKKWILDGESRVCAGWRGCVCFAEASSGKA